MVAGTDVWIAQITSRGRAPLPPAVEVPPRGLAPGDRVLIHSATGGVGQAAIAIARQAGAEIFATAGSPRKRASTASVN